MSSSLNTWEQASPLGTEETGGKKVGRRDNNSPVVTGNKNIKRASGLWKEPQDADRNGACGGEDSRKIKATFHSHLGMPFEFYTSHMGYPIKNKKNGNLDEFVIPALRRLREDCEQ